MNSLFVSRVKIDWGLFFGCSVWVREGLEELSADQIMRIGSLGRNILHYVALDGDGAAMRFLVQKLSEDQFNQLLNQQEWLLRDTPLHFAIRSEKSDVVRVLLDRNADVEIPNRLGWTAKSQAVDYEPGAPGIAWRYGLDPDLRLIINPPLP